MDLKNKIAVVTGANGAIGSKLVENLKSHGVSCVLIDKDSEYKCDFSKPQEIIAVCKAICSKYPKIDMLFNVAGVGIYKNLKELSLDEWQNTFSINVTAPFLLSKLLLTSMETNGGGLIFNIGSGMGVIPAKDRSSYCASKFALRGLSLSMSKDLKPVKVDVCLLTLGSVMTPFGTGGIDKRKELQKTGKKYLSVDEVTNKIIDIAQASKREDEYVLYPDGYI